MIKFFEALATLFFLTYLISMWVSFGFLPAIVGTGVYLLVAFLIKKVSFWIKKPKENKDTSVKVYHAINDIRGKYYKNRMDNKITQAQYTEAESILNELWGKFK